MKSFIPVFLLVLSNNLVREGLKGEEARFGGTPFSLFSVTKDYYANPHIDDKDYGFGFVIWLLPRGAIELEHLPTFWLLEYKVKFRPTYGSAFLFDATSTVHCTTSTARGGVIGIALVQKTAYITKLRVIVDNPTSKVGKAFLKAKKNYEHDKVIYFLSIFECVIFDIMFCTYSLFHCCLNYVFLGMPQDAHRVEALF
jgi:hypothetical protein